MEGRLERGRPVFDKKEIMHVIKAGIYFIEKLSISSL